MTAPEEAIVMDRLHTCEDPPEVNVETLDINGVRDRGGQAHERTRERGVLVLRGSFRSRGTAGARKQGRRTRVPEGDGPKRTGRSRGRSGVRDIES